MKVQVKICGIRSLELAQAAIDAGADFIGLNFVPDSERFIDFSTAKAIAKRARGRVKIVGIFENASVEVINKIETELHLDFVQLHGEESPEYSNQITLPVIKAFRFPREFSLEEARKQMRQFDVAYYLVDRIKQSEGAMLDLNKVSILAREFSLIFAGGLHSENVAEVIKRVKLQIVDVASGVEINGQQDGEKIKHFIENVKGVTV